MANEQISEETLNNAIAKYAGDDQQHADALKKHVSNFIGYTNQMAQMPGIDEPGIKKVMGGGVEQSFLHGNITPGGVRQLVGSGIGLRNQEIGYQKQLARGAKSKASSASARGEAYKQLAGFEATDPLDEAIKDYMNNPRNEDGTFKTLDQLKKELEGVPIGEGDIAQWKIEDVEARLAQRVPEAMKESFQEDYYKSLGYSNVEAENLVKYDRYATGQMSESEAELYKMTDPTFAARAEAVKEMPGLQSEFDKLQSNDAEALTYKELEQKYPNITPEIAKPAYERAALDDISGITQEKGISPVTTDEETGEQTIQSLESYLESDSVNDIKKNLSIIYQGILTPAEIDYLLYQNYLQQTGGQQ